MRVVSILFLAALHLSIYSQEQGLHGRTVPAPVPPERSRDHTDTIRGNFIKLNLARLLFVDFAVSYERKISRKISLEMEFGYQYPLESHEHSDMGNPFFGLTLLLPGQGFSLEAGPKIYRLNRNHPGFYILPWAIFKDMWCTDVSFPSSVYGNKEKCYPYGDNRYQVYGAILRIGTMKSFGGFILDFYTGVGIKVKSNHYNLYGYWDNEKEKLLTYSQDGSPVSTRKTTACPAISLGLKIGFGFGR
jgi:hypothetical protein